MKFEDGGMDFNVLQTDGDDFGIDEKKTFGSSRTCHQVPARMSIQLHILENCNVMLRWWCQRSEIVNRL